MASRPPGDLREKRRRRGEVPLETRVPLDVLLGGAPAVLVALLLLARGAFEAKTQWTVGLAVVLTWLFFALAARERVTRPLQTLGNLLAALREGDYSLRARGAVGDDALAVARRELNALASLLRDQRAGAIEAAALLEKVMAEIDVAIFAFDAQKRLVLANRAGERLLGPHADGLLGAHADALGLDELLGGPAPRTVDAAFPGGASRWEVRRADFRQRGRPHQLLVLADLSRALREEERAAWQRLVRVLGHEINNSLAPIMSIAGQLRRTLASPARPPDWETSAAEGLAVVGRRAESLGRFLGAYARLARLPPPRLAPVDMDTCIRRVARLEDRVPVRVADGPAMSLVADGDLLDQLLINLLRNAAEASLETGGGIEVAWSRRASTVEITVLDEGRGIGETENLFVPFFTTKPAGTGIGLVLARQIAEAHGGSLALENRPDARGCLARLRLPLRTP